MHVSTKDTSKDGKEHILTSVIEADGAFELAPESAMLTGEIVSVKRTSSGGIEVIAKVNISDPAVAEINVEVEVDPVSDAVN